MGSKLISLISFIRGLARNLRINAVVLTQYTVSGKLEAMHAILVFVSIHLDLISGTRYFLNLIPDR